MRCHGVAVDLGTEKQRLLFASLALRYPNVVSKDRLIDDLWGDDPPPSADSTLAGYLSLLRKAIRNAGGDPAEVIVTRPPGYVLGRGVELDVVELRERSACDDAIGAAELVQGPTLSDLRHVDFISRAADPIDIEVAEVQELAADERLEAGDWRGARDALLPLIDHHPFRESLRVLLATALYRGGRQADALAVIDEARKVLRDELGLDLGNELASLEDRILRHDPSLQPAPGDGRSTVASLEPETTSTGSVRRGGATLGRERELGVLVELVDGLGRGEGGLLLLTGHAGIGKTHLVDELERIARERGHLVVRSGSSEGAADPPLYPLIEHINQLLVADQTAGLVAAANRHPGDRVMRASLTNSPPSASQLVDGEQRSELLETIVRGTRDLLEAGPFVSVVEDVHWSDEATLAAMERCAGLPAQGPMLLVCTGRPDELTDREEGRRFLRSMTRQTNLTHLRLGGLDAAATAGLVEASGGGSLSLAELREFLDRTDGNPLFVKEVASLAGDRGVAVTETELPDTVVAAIGQNIDRLPDETIDVLTCAAFAHRLIEPEVDAVVLDLDADVVEEHYEIGRQAGFLTLESSGAYRFTHALMRAALYDRVRPRQRARLHAALGEAIQQRRLGRTDRIDAAARHLCLGARAGTAEAGIDLARKAALEADASGATDLAWNHLDRALAALDFHPDPDPRLRVDLLVERALLAEALGDSDGAVDDFDEAFTLALATADEDCVAAVALAGREAAGSNRSRFWWNPGRAGTDRLRVALARIEPGSDPAKELTLQSALGADGAPFLGAADAAGWAATARRGLAEAERLRTVSPQLIAELRVEGLLSGWFDQPPDALVTAFDEVVAAEVDRTDRVEGPELVARLGALAAQLETGNLESLAQRMDEGEARAAHLPESSLRWYLTAFQAAWLQATDRLEELTGLLDVAAELTVGSGRAAAENVAMARAATGLLAGEIEPHSQVILERASSFRRPNLVAPVAFSMAYARRPADARNIVDSVPWSELERPEPPTATAIGRIFTLGTTALLGDRGRVAALYAELEHLSGRLVVSGPGKSFQGPADYYLALAAVLLENDEAAKLHDAAGRRWCEAVDNQRFIARFDELKAGRAPFA